VFTSNDAVEGGIIANVSNTVLTQSDIVFSDNVIGAGEDDVDTSS
jgi:hypothetical protein